MKFAAVAALALMAVAANAQTTTFTEYNTMYTTVSVNGSPLSGAMSTGLPMSGSAAPMASGSAPVAMSSVHMASALPTLATSPANKQGVPSSMASASAATSAAGRTQISIALAAVGLIGAVAMF